MPAGAQYEALAERVTGRWQAAALVAGRYQVRSMNRTRREHRLGGTTMQHVGAPDDGGAWGVPWDLVGEGEGLRRPHARTALRRAMGRGKGVTQPGEVAHGALGGIATAPSTKPGTWQRPVFAHKRLPERRLAQRPAGSWTGPSPVHRIDRLGSTELDLPSFADWPGGVSQAAPPRPTSALLHFRTPDERPPSRGPSRLYGTDPRSRGRHGSTGTEFVAAPPVQQAGARSARPAWAPPIRLAAVPPNRLAATLPARWAVDLAVSRWGRPDVSPDPNVPNPSLVRPGFRPAGLGTLPTQWARRRGAQAQSHSWLSIGAMLFRTQPDLVQGEGGVGRKLRSTKAPAFDHRQTGLNPPLLEAALREGLRVPSGRAEYLGDDRSARLRQSQSHPGGAALDARASRWFPESAAHFFHEAQGRGGSGWLHPSAEGVAPAQSGQDRTIQSGLERTFWRLTSPLYGLGSRPWASPETHRPVQTSSTYREDAHQRMQRMPLAPLPSQALRRGAEAGDRGFTLAEMGAWAGRPETHITSVVSPWSVPAQPGAAILSPRLRHAAHLLADRSPRGEADSSLPRLHGLGEQTRGWAPVSFRPTARPRVPLDHRRSWAADQANSQRNQPQALRATQGGLAAGTPLPTPLRATMERLLNTSLHTVRLHTDGAARQVTSAMRADAVASGNHLFFAPGRFAPDTPRGLALLAHELTHVRQAQEGRVGATPLAGRQTQTPLAQVARPAARLQAQQGWSSQATAEREREALTMEQAVLAGRSGAPTPNPGLPTLALPSFAAAVGRVESAVTAPELHLALTVAPVHAAPAAASSDRSLATTTAGEPSLTHSDAVGPATSTPTPATGAPAELPDLPQLAQAVARILERNARMEAERRGVQRWT